MLYCERRKKVKVVEGVTTHISRLLLCVSATLYTAQVLRMDSSHRAGWETGGRGVQSTAEKGVKGNGGRKPREDVVKISFNYTDRKAASGERQEGK
jgi:hypothetical protein